MQESLGGTYSLCDAWVQIDHNSVSWLQDLSIFKNLI